MKKPFKEMTVEELRREITLVLGELREQVEFWKGLSLSLDRAAVAFQGFGEAMEYARDLSFDPIPPRPGKIVGDSAEAVTEKRTSVGVDLHDAKEGEAVALQLGGPVDPGAIAAPPPGKETVHFATGGIVPIGGKPLIVGETCQGFSGAAKEVEKVTGAELPAVCKHCYYPRSECEC